MWQYFTGKQPLTLTVFACGAFATYVILAIITGRCLYADGSYYLLRVLQAGTFTEMISNRSFAVYLFQLPVVAAIKLGITNIHWMTLAFGIGCFCSWPVAMLLCYRMAPQHFWVVMLACAAGYLNAAFMAVGEHIVAHAFFWPALFAILFVRPLNLPAAVILLLTAGLLIRSYESLLFLGPPLVVLLVWRMITGRETPWQQVVLGTAAVFFAMAAYFAWEGVCHPSDPGNYGAFTQGPLSELRFPTWTIQMSYFWGVLILALKSPQVVRLLRQRIGSILLGCAVLLWGGWPLLVPEQLNPVGQYESRFLDLLVPLALMPAAVSLAIKPQWLAAQKQDLVRLSACMLIAQSLWQVSATWQWQGYVRNWRNLLSTQKGPIDLSKIYGNRNSDGGQALRFDWPWANPCMSLMLGPDKVQALIMPGRTLLWQPFNPLEPQSLPNLQRYGLDYTQYIEALQRPKAK